MKLDHVERFNKLLGDVMASETEMLGAHAEGWLPKYLRRSGLSLYWAWAYEFTLPELLALMTYATNTDESLLSALRQQDKHESLLQWTESLESEKRPSGLKRRQIVYVLSMLYALLHSMRAIGFHSLSINELVRLGLEGDALALRRAVAIDPLVLSTPSVAAFVAGKMLKGDRKELVHLYSAAAKGPNKQLQPNWELRYMGRVIAEGKVIEAHGREAVFRMFTERLHLYDVRGNDPFKGLFTLFRRWREDATT